MLSLGSLSRFYLSQLLSAGLTRGEGGGERGTLD